MGAANSQKHMMCGLCSQEKCIVESGPTVQKKKEKRKGKKGGVSSFIYSFIRSYLQTWGDHSVDSIVLPWYPGGHVLSKMQGRHLYLQDRHGEGSQKKSIKQKITKTATQSESAARKTGAEEELQELKKNCI